MDKFLLLIIVYIGFSLISSLFKKSPPKQPASKRLKQSQHSSKKGFQAKFEQYFAQLEERFGEKKATPPPLPSQRSKSSQTAPAKQAKRKAPTVPEIEEIKELTDVEVIKELPQQSQSLVAFNARRGYMQGIILSEVLGPPLCKRKQRRQH